MGNPRLHAVRTAYRQRLDSGSRDLGYTIYAVGMLALVAIVPAVRVLFLALTTPSVLLAIGGPDVSGVVAATAGCLLVLLGGLGAVRGPAHYPPFLAAILMGSDLTHYSVLRRTFWLSALAVAAGLMIVCTVFAVALVFGGQIEFYKGLPFIVGGAAFGILTSVVWGWGQRLGPRSAWVLATGIGFGVLVTYVLPPFAALTPWGWLSLLFPSVVARDELWPLVALCVVALGAVLATRFLLNGMSTHELVSQSQRWESATSAAISGDPNLALSIFRPLPSIGRSWNAIRPRFPLWGVFWLRDLTGAYRTPVRFMFAVVGLLAAGVIVAVGAMQPSSGWVLGAAGSLLGYVSLGSLSDGLRHAVEAYSAPQLYGLSRVALLMYHSSLPITLGVLSMMLGSVPFMLFGASVTGAYASILVATVVFLVRLFDSAKGPLSPSLLAPIPTPFGDLSGTIVLAWQADAVLLVSIAGALTLVGFQNGGSAAGVVIAVSSAVVILALSVKRFRRL